MIGLRALFSLNRFFFTGIMKMLLDMKLFDHIIKPFFAMHHGYGVP